MTTLEGHPDQFVAAKSHRASSWDRAVVFRPKDNSVDIKKEREIYKDLEDGSFTCQRVKLRTRGKNVSLVKNKNDDIVELKDGTERGENDVFLARLNLDHLGLTNRTLFLLGYISTLYVATDVK
ncbi:hypothetical protein T440DRAFT_555568 [Plenodomus tracheiphilus IPT5]|uniref:Uncharacterized protein n=1 Tax=Plenodomus tracheiphilus IPT5 TaxID=1408161 RepID=A0A6A7B3S1_9PLEO|nr:hypothetical protein T440DRAFT_555568 [Plenodomus tracheiphilus IPT5]